MYDLVIVGGGIAGLSLAHRFRGSVLVLEAGARVAGRMKNEHGMNLGAWRIADTHARALKLSKKLGIALRPTYSSRERPKSPHISTAPGLSTKSTLLKRVPPQKADEIERATGYPGTLQGRRQTYTTHEKVHNYFEPTSKHGMNIFTRKLATKVSASAGKKLLTACRAYKAERTTSSLYEVLFVQRVDNKFVKKAVACKKLAFACLPESWPATNFEVGIEPLKHAIGTVPLCRIFVKTAAPLKPLHLNTMSQAGQLIAADRNTLVVYTSGEMADLQNSMYLQDKAQHKKFLHALIAKHAPHVVIDKQQNMRVAFWQSAVSFWKTSIDTETTTSMLHKCVVPHPIKLPGFVVVGEAFSDVQGWCEGALQTVDRAISYLTNERCGGHRLFASRPARTMVYDGRVIDVQFWLDRHPGGRQALLNHLGDASVTHTFRAVHMRTPHALKHLLNLQIGFLTDADEQKTRKK